MSFSTEWLDLREPADHRARDPGLMAALGTALARSDRPVRIVDLGCGTGSNLRALAPHLPERQCWWLLDHEPALLEAARARLAEWADGSRETGEALVLHKDRSTIEVRFRRVDLAAGLADALDMRPDLVTAAALFDLVSPDWIAAAAKAVADAGAAFLTALTYDGRESWSPSDPRDDAILAAFLAHQRGDKGFGGAAGPDAPDMLALAFGRLGYRVERADSTWHLGAGDGALIGHLAAGIAEAAAATGRVAAAGAEAWRLHRSSSGVTATIGHADLLALPQPGRQPKP